MPHITRRQFCGLVTAISLAGCTKPQATNPPLPMGPPLDPLPGGAAKVSGEPDAKVKFETSQGDFVIAVHRAWSPMGADRFLELVNAGFYDECRFFRVVPDFMVQWGINGDPNVMEKWRDANIQDDSPGPNRQSNQRGFVTFANSGPNSRSAQVFINFKDNSFLDPPERGFSPFGQVTEGMEVVDSINAKYLELPNQGRIQAEGNEYLNKEFPELDYIKKATILDPDAESKSADEPKTDAPTETEM